MGVVLTHTLAQLDTYRELDLTIVRITRISISTAGAASGLQHKAMTVLGFSLVLFDASSEGLRIALCSAGCIEPRGVHLRRTCRLWVSLCGTLFAATRLIPWSLRLCVIDRALASPTGSTPPDSRRSRLHLSDSQAQWPVRRRRASLA